jgi:hypothetical protein
VAPSHPQEEKEEIRQEEGAPPASPGKKVLADLIGLCFNCFAKDHTVRQCPNPSYCFRCREPGHQAQDCTKPHILPASRQGRQRGRQLVPPAGRSRQDRSRRPHP